MCDQGWELMGFLQHGRPDDERHMATVLLIRQAIEMMVTCDDENGVFVTWLLTVISEELPEAVVII